MSAFRVNVTARNPKHEELASPLWRPSSTPVSSRGKVVLTAGAVHSEHRKLRTIMAKGTNEAGQATKTVTVYDRQ